MQRRNVTRPLVALAALSTFAMPASPSYATQYDWELIITMEAGDAAPQYQIVDPAQRDWNCSSEYAQGTAATTFTVTCIPGLPRFATGFDPNMCRPGAKADITSLITGNSVSATATCGSSGASCTATALPFSGSCHRDAPAAVPGTSVQCATSPPLVTAFTGWSASCHDHA